LHPPVHSYRREPPAVPVLDSANCAAIVP
jgi:hypothetical protein